MIKSVIKNLTYPEIELVSSTLNISLPKQNNINDCGLFICCHAVDFWSDSPTYFSPNKTELMDKINKIVKQIIVDRLELNKNKIIAMIKSDIVTFSSRSKIPHQELNISILTEKESNITIPGPDQDEVYNAYYTPLNYEQLNCTDPDINTCIDLDCECIKCRVGKNQGFFK